VGNRRPHTEEEEKKKNKKKKKGETFIPHSLSGVPRNFFGVGYAMNIFRHCTACLFPGKIIHYLLDEKSKQTLKAQRANMLQ
jgi:hypothetical protein